MSSQSQTFSDHREFGEALIETEDLDPVYTILHRSELPQDQKLRWCLSYWLLYNAGFSSFVSEKQGSEFYGLLYQGLGTVRRGAERRHFRGSKALKSVAWIESRGKPESVLEWLYETVEYGEVARRAAEIPMFGSWITWKLCDMGERCLGFPIDFSDCSLAIYRDPAQGAALIETGDWRAKGVDVAEVAKRVEREFHTFLAPPGFDRPVGIQEVETIFCKWKAFFKGSYYLGKDIVDIGERLEETDGRTAKRLSRCLPAVPDRKGKPDEGRG